MNKNWQILLISIFVIATVITLWAFTLNENNKRTIKDIIININYNNKDTLIVKEDINDAIKDLLLNRNISQIDLGKLEIRCQNIPWVKTADVSLSIDGILKIDITQRNPLLRIWLNNEYSFYMDDMGFFPLREGYPARIINVLGYLPKLNNNYWYDKNTDSLNYDANFYYKLISLAKTIYADEFICALTEQIYISPDHKVSIEPKIFNHTIIIGDISDINIKFLKLKKLYQYLFKKDAINQYKLINLNYKNQVVCTKKNIINP